MLQSLVFNSSPWHSRPPFSGLGLSQDRSLRCFPVPHGSLHDDQGDHRDQRPLTTPKHGMFLFRDHHRHHEPSHAKFYDVMRTNDIHDQAYMALCCNRETWSGPQDSPPLHPTGRGCYRPSVGIGLHLHISRCTLSSPDSTHSKTR